MKTTLITFFVGSLFLFYSCSKQSTTEDKSKTSKVDTTKKITQKTDTVKESFNNELSSDGMKFKVQTIGEGSLRNLSIIVEKDEKQLASIKEEIDGQVIDAVVTDLNNNKKPDVLIFVISAGSGAYGEIYGYEFTDKDWAKIKLAKLKGEMVKGYMGHDKFKIIDTNLYRIFPLYKENDPNSSPTGGTRTIEYSLNEKLELIPQKVSDKE